ncbi:MAG: 2-C-methyl-D-erythritol 4-phosphate cytidylyltransferase, partial [Alphaproteobacteria bacterium]|nr:2-C-methyl-D-erythritol 4-phosphate cytidylyltransferase [Alphaproteobacteria bacterium]
MTIAAIIVAAGRGERAGADLPKQFMPVGGRALVAHSVAAFARHPAISRIIL